MTGLSIVQSHQANAREYSEPVRWLGSVNRKCQFISSLELLGATVLAGGRFLSVSGDHDKGRALRWLRSVYQQFHPGVQIHDLAIGDSDNDCAMLEASATALWIRSPVHDFPDLDRGPEHVLYSNAYGPAGWAEGVAKWLPAAET